MIYEQHRSKLMHAVTEGIEHSPGDLEKNVNAFTLRVEAWQRRWDCYISPWITEAATVLEEEERHRVSANFPWRDDELGGVSLGYEDEDEIALDDNATARSSVPHGKGSTLR